MKKHLLIFCMAAALLSCSKDNDEPSGGGGGNNNQGTADKGWSVTYIEYIQIENGEPVLLNTSKECLDWKKNYGSNFTFTDLSTLRTGIWQTNYPHLNFQGIDNMLSSYVSFTVGNTLYEGSDQFVANALNIEKNEIYGTLITYSYVDGNTRDENEMESLWALFVSVYSDPNNILNGDLPENYLKWVETHKEYLSHENIFDEPYEFDIAWSFDLNSFNEEYVKNEIYPYISTSIPGVLTNDVYIFFENGNMLIRKFSFYDFE